MKCDRCGSEIKEGESFSYQGRTVCEECYMELGLHFQGCDPWATYTATRIRDQKNLKGTEGLTDLQKKVYGLVKDKGRVTRDDVKLALLLSEAELDAQIAALMHSELVKERSEAGRFYLIPVA
ncbi:MAG: hypothetical protein HYX79_10275 [Chloroflexi bacterium]|nr:hypothetical protein [Chloroflexota bacterium]